jgi:hypothetical protein
MRVWVGNEPRFFPHVAQHDFEAWLLPYWANIKALAGTNRNAPPGQPEHVNHNKPPAHHLKEVFMAGSKHRAYNKPIMAARILRDKNLAIAAEACPTLRDFLNEILRICGANQL